MSVDNQLTAQTARAPRRTSPSLRAVVLVGLVVSALLAGGLSLFASSHPDGLEFVAEKLGFIDVAKGSASADSPLADYTVHGVVSPEPLAGSLAGLIGILVVAILAFGLMWLLRRRTSTRSDD